MLRTGYFLLAVTVFLSSGLAVADEEIVDMVVNGDFENDLDGWKIYQDIRGSTGAMEIDDEDAAVGKKSARLIIEVAGADYHTVRIEQEGPQVEAGETYTLSAWLKAEEDRLVSLCVWGPDVKWQLGGPQPGEIAITTEWQEYFGTFTATSTGAGHISMRAGELAVDVWVDKVRFYEGEYIPTEIENAVTTDGKLAITWGMIKSKKPVE